MHWKECVSEFESSQWNLSGGSIENHKTFLTIVWLALQIGIGGVRNKIDSFVAVSVCEGYCIVGTHQADCKCVPTFRRILLPPLSG